MLEDGPLEGLVALVVSPIGDDFVDPGDLVILGIHDEQQGAEDLIAILDQLGGRLRSHSRSLLSSRESSRPVATAARRELLSRSSAFRAGLVVTVC